jgi:seryl-tRNA synthetase
MIDLKQLRENPERFRDGAAKKQIPADIDRLLKLDERRRALRHEQQELRATQNRLAKEIGPEIGQLSGRLKSLQGPEKAALETKLAELKDKPARLKDRIHDLDQQLAAVEPEFNRLLLKVPLPPDPDVPVGAGSQDNVEISRWNPDWFDPARSFEENKGFPPKSHIELVRDLGLADFERGVKLAGSRSYILTADGARLHNAVLRCALDYITGQGFIPMTIPVLVREEAMTGTGFFPAGREQAYRVDESSRDKPDEPAHPESGAQAPPAHDLYLTGTGEVSLMGLHMDEILDEAKLPLRYCTISTCFRREAGAAGKDTAGLFRIHQFDKVEQVVICRADEAESRRWHRQMIQIVEQFLQNLGLPYRLLQCCTGDLGPKNADMIDLECWMPGRGEPGPDGRPRGAFAETHSASRLYDFQCRRLNMRYRPGGEAGKGETIFCHSLNNTVLASPRILIPILEMYQNRDGSVTVPEVLRAYMGGVERIG